MFGWFSKKIDASTIEKHGRVLANKRSQAPDRWESMQFLAGVLRDPKNAPPEASDLVTTALLPRFTYYTDPTISDGEEKDYAYRLIVEAGEGAAPAVRRFMERAESLTWPLKMLERLLPAEALTAELLHRLEPMETDYERDPQRKLQVLQALEERKGDGIANAVVRFTEDANETARFHAVAVVLSQADAADHREALVRVLRNDESGRVKVRVLEGFRQASLSLADERPSLERTLPPGWSLDANGVPRTR